MSQARPFLIGFAGGGLVAAVAFWSLGERWAGAVAPERDGAVERLPEVAELRRENARLRAEIVEAAAVHDRRSASGPEVATTDDTTTEPPPPLAEPEYVDFLIAEFEEALRSGAMRQWLLESPIEGVGLLTRFWMTSDHPERALNVLERVDLPGSGADFAQWIGTALHEGGNTALATRAFLMGLRDSPLDWSIVASLSRCAPDAALNERAAMEAVYGQDPDFRAQTALLQIASGQTETGYATLDALIAEGAVPHPVWELLVSQDPAAAESRLRSLLESGEADQEWVQSSLVEAVRHQGRRDDSIREIQRLLDRFPNNVWAAEALGELDRGRALAWLEGRLALAPTAELHAMHGEQLIQAGRTQEGIGALMQAWEMGPGEGYGERLLELIPERVAPRMLQEAARTNDDEIYGDVADAFWRIGRRQEARSYWERALRIDPSDGEWIEKLRALAQGRDPLQ